MRTISLLKCTKWTDEIIWSTGIPFVNCCIWIKETLFVGGEKVLLGGGGYNFV